MVRSDVYILTHPPEEILNPPLFIDDVSQIGEYGPTAAIYTSQKKTYAFFYYCRD
jgi:hypothetical protein